MIGRRYIDAEELLEYFEKNRKRATIRDLLAKWLRRQPKMPELVSRQGAAQLLDRQSAHLDRLGDRLPKPVKVENGHPAYLKSEIEALAAELREEWS